MSSRKKRFLLWAPVLLCALLLGACGRSAEDLAPPPAPTPVQAETPLPSPEPAETPEPSAEPVSIELPLRPQEDECPAFLPLDEFGRFRPDETLSRGEVAQLVYWCLDPDWELDGKPLSRWKAEDALAELGLLESSGSRTAPISRYEFYQLLEKLCSPQQTEARFEDVRPQSPLYPTFQTAVARGWLRDGEGVHAYPNKALTRRDAARALSQMLGRQGDDEQRFELVGTIVDVAQSDPDFWLIAAAAIDHRCDPAGHWLDSQPAALREPGFCFVDGRLYAFDEQGSPVVNGEYQGILFNAVGEETSGDAELDALVWETLGTLVQFDTMSREDMLKAVFNYVGNSVKFRYLGRGHYAQGSTGWETEAAKVMLKTHRGNCYNFAAAFWALSRALGYDATAYSGCISGLTEADERNLEKGLAIQGWRDHSWVEIDVDGEARIFDAEMAFSYSDFRTFYNAGEEIRARFKYRIQDED